jgi:anti-sigma-K factor RskA
MDAIHESRIVSHFRWERAEQMPDALLMLDIDFKVAHQHDRATSSKQTTSYWQTRPRWPVALLTNIRATVALPPEIKWA